MTETQAPYGTPNPTPTVSTPIGDLPVTLKDGNLLFDIEPRYCKGCGMKLAGPMNVAWAKVFVRECFLYCCACCPYGKTHPCPKELKEQRRTP